MFPVRRGYQYRVEAWLRGTGLTTAGAGIGFRSYTRPTWEMNTWCRREFLESVLREAGWDFWRSNNVPINIGEFGVSEMAIRLNRGGLQWLADTLDLADQYNVNWNYFVYNSVIYGLFNNIWGAGGRPAGRNAPLMDFFHARLTSDSQADADNDGLPDSWEELYFGDPTAADALADDDGDDLVNLLEFAFGGHPLLVDAASLLPVVRLTIPSSTRYLTLTYRQNKAATNLLFEPQAADALTAGAWSNAGVVEVGSEDSGDGWSITARDGVPIRDAERRFMRLRVVTPQRIESVLKIVERDHIA
jgi:hypothetical protein